MAIEQEGKQAMNETTTLEQEARKMGEEHGRNAASWYFDGNTTTETYAAVLRGMDDGDPAIYDTFPAAPLSGEFADGPTPASLMDDLGLDDETIEDWQRDELCTMYEEGFSDASQAEIERTARYHVA